MTSNPLSDKLKTLANELLELTVRNPFLKIQESKCLPIEGEHPCYLISILTENKLTCRLQINKQLSKLPLTEVLKMPKQEGFSDVFLDFVLPKPKKQASLKLDLADLELPKEEDSNLEPSEKSEKEAQQSFKQALETLRKHSEEKQLEQGVHVLHLLLGCVYYTSSLTKKEFKAPLCVMPVVLDTQAMTLTGHEEPPKLNIALNYLLKSELSIELPDIDFSEELNVADLTVWFQDCCHVLEKANAEIKVTAECFLGNVDTQRYVMLDEILKHADELATHPNIVSLFSNDAHEMTTSETHKFEMTSELYKEETLLTVMDCDPSQQETIHHALSGSSLVIEGPPGTGKSQTITNLIGMLLYEGKRVLFVSEKQTALDVVYKRLDSVGFGLFCLDLHNPKMTLKKVCESVQSLLVLDESTLQTKLHAFDKLRYQQARDALRNYSSELLATTHNALGQSTYQVFSNQFRKDTRLDFKLYEDPSFKQFARGLTSEALLDIETLAQKIDRVQCQITTDLWDFVSITTLESMKREYLAQKLTTLLSVGRGILSALRFIANTLGVPIQETLIDCEKLKKVFNLVAHTPLTTASLIQNPIWDDIPDTVKCLIESGKAYNTQKKILDDYFVKYLDKETRLELNQKQKFLETKPSWLLWAFPSYYQFKKRLSPYISLSSQCSDFKYHSKQLVLLEHHEQLFQEINNSSLAHHFGQHWQGVDSDWDKLSDYISWMAQARRCIIENSLTPHGIEVASVGLDLSLERELKEQFTYLDKALIELRTLVKELKNPLDLEATKSELDILFTESLAVTLNQFEQWKDHLSTLQLVVQRNALFKIAQDNYPLLYQMIQNKLESNEPQTPIELLFKNTLHQTLMSEVLSQSPFLTGLTEGELKDYQKTFALQDRELLIENRRSIFKKLVTRKGSFVQQRAFTEAGKWFKRKRGIGSVRNYVSKHIEQLIQLKPCWMMSPLSLSKYTPCVANLFDVVIFDEASQVRPIDACGALFRAKQSILVGDPKQLPPTAFFAKQITSDTEEGVPEESILDQAMTAFSTSRLKWHYRSRHESLIQFSNKSFYDQSLIFFPSNKEKQESLGLSFHYVANATYNTSGSKEAHPNLVEAQTVIEAVGAYMLKYPNHTVGIVALNERQKISLELLWDAFLSNNEDVQRIAQSYPEGEGVFIKSLESVQGDERDAIFVSLTFGKTVEGKFSMNFGPINGKTGARRLNVLATRAKSCLKLFASFQPEDLRIGINENLQLLQEWIRLAQGKHTASISSTDTIYFDSPFEEEVYQALTNAGYCVRTQIGQVGYRIDLAVEDPNDSGRFLLGIECDGATYHSSKNARESDRLRQEVLEGLGWTIYRIWSTERDVSFIG